MKDSDIDLVVDLLAATEDYAKQLVDLFRQGALSSDHDRAVARLTLIQTVAEVAARAAGNVP